MPVTSGVSSSNAGLKVGEPRLPELGLRQRNKLQKRQRIRNAARELFSKYGYEAATLRQIATRAHVALGTLFNYAQDKRDLVFLIFNEELSPLTDEALRAAQQHRSLIDQLMAIATRHYEYFSRDPLLSRILLQELVFYSEGKQAADFQEIRERLLDGIGELVRSAQAKRQIRTKEDPAVIARAVFFMYSTAIRWWIASPQPHPRTGLKDLRRLFRLLLDGLRPASHV
jgi:AcrR family transcriptional regulator